ncbi:MAG: T9SS type A sorting domain-containing protein [Bacteroidales bacterium]|nr:T9SS type A sorting domain-containing protein [Bacteroidales bacterium]
MKKKIVCFIIIVYGSTLCFAQQAVSASGGKAAGAGGSANYTVGQVAYKNYIESAGTITQGVQQPYEIFVHTKIEEAPDISLACSAYPNPVNNSLLLKIENNNLENLMFVLCDANGKTLENKRITAKETIIQIADLNPSIYFLRVINSQKEIISFKIIKTQ